MNPHDDGSWMASGDEQAYGDQFSFPFNEPNRLLSSHLTFNLTLDTTSTPNYTSSAPSPLSSASNFNIEPPHGLAALPEFDPNIHPGIAPNIVVEDEGDDMFPVFPNNNGQSFPADGHFDANIQSMLHHYRLPNGYSPSQYKQFENDLERFVSTVRDSIPNISTAQLLLMKSQLRETCSWLETIIQDKIDCTPNTPNTPNSVNSNKEMFTCVLCPFRKRRTYNTRGSIMRHLSSHHNPRRQYWCPGCPWRNYRKDKVHEHWRTRHSQSKLNHIHIHSITLSPPAFCQICGSPVNRWETYLNCVIEHCRLHNGVSRGTSASQSRRNSDDSGSGGSGGNDYNGYHAPGNPSGGNGPPPQFPYGGGSNPSRGDNFYSGNGSYSYGNDYSRGDNSAVLSGKTLPYPLRSFSDMDDNLSGTESPSSRNSGESGYAADQSKSTDLLDYDQPLHSSLEEKSSSVPFANGPTPPGKSRSCHPREPSQTTSLDDKGLSRITPLRRLIDKAPKKHAASKLDNAPPKECKTCGHAMNCCPKCQSEKGAVDQCHLCADKARQRYAPEKALVLDDYDQYFDFACNGMSDRGRSARRIFQALHQASQAFKPKDIPCPTDNRSTAAEKDTPSDAIFHESSKLAPFMKDIDRLHPPYISEKTVIDATRSGHLEKTPLETHRFHFTQCRSVVMVLTLGPMQASNKLGSFDTSTRKTSIKASSGLYNELTTGTENPDAVCKLSSHQTAAAVSSVLHVSNSLRALRLEAFSSNSVHDETILANPYSRGTLSLYEIVFEPDTPKKTHGLCVSFYRASYGAQEERSSEHYRYLQDAYTSHTKLTSRRRRFVLRAKLQVVIEILVLQASVASRFPVSQELGNRSLNGLNAEPSTDLLAASADLDSFDPRYLSQWIQEKILSLSVVDSTMFATPICKVDEIRKFVESLTSSWETPISSTTIEKQLRNIRLYLYSI